MAKRQMVINYVPGDECRVAIVEGGKLDEFHAERAEAVSHVGNIYVGRVVNVEPSIQAAFIDFGLDANGFLHVSDLHPQYFPGEGDETTERVGKKTPRRERPPIQECLRRGQEIAVQVLKEGVGTKGPTVTSYLSIPGRFLVMMPQMDRVGVSRKVEDEETRRKMREILDQLELPEGFGFIVRTAGLDRTKAELKRDLAYLMRLWKDMEKRWSKGDKPRLLYSESDLLVRALRDMLTADIERILIDDESALKRAARFLKIVAPRSATRLVHYTARTPIFHALGIEPQIRTIHAREVPLPSGGRLVIDETEALVAIDVNSGKSRDAGDAETNAYRTNLEAAEEICRQLRLRDLGGIVINDLIDMRFTKHRHEVEARFKDLLKHDRARTTLESISEFGVLEMTRQRMRGSQESVHFADCPTCRGRGLVMKPDSVAADAMRELGTLLEYDRVARVELVVGPRIAGELLSTKRRSLNRLERLSGKHVDVRVSETIPVDRVTFYAYDDRGADIDTAKLPAPSVRNEDLKPWEPAPGEQTPADDWADEDESSIEETLEAEPQPEVVEETLELEPVGAPGAPGGPARQDEHGAALEDGGRRRRRRRRRGGSSGPGRDGERPGRAMEPAGARPGGRASRPPSPIDGADDHRADTPAGEPVGAGPDGAPTGLGPDEQGEGGRRRRRRRRRRGGRAGAMGVPGEPTLGADGLAAPAGAPAPNSAPGMSPLPPDHDQAPAERTGAGEPNATEPDRARDGTAGGGEGLPGGPRRGRRRRGRRGRGGGDGRERPEGAPAYAGGPNDAGATGAPEPSSPESESMPLEPAESGPPGQPQDQSGPGGGKRRRRRGRGGKGRGGDGGGAAAGEGQPRREGRPAGGQSGPGRPPHGQDRQPSGNSAPPPKPGAAPGQQQPAPGPKPVRTLYASRRRLAPSELKNLSPDV